MMPALKKFNETIYHFVIIASDFFLIPSMIIQVLNVPLSSWGKLSSRSHSYTYMYM